VRAHSIRFSLEVKPRI